MKTVIYHNADFDGIFCREIARKFLDPDPSAETDVQYIGWNFGDPPLEIPSNAIYVMDLPLDRVFGFDYPKVGNERGPNHPTGLVWIDHHKTSIDTHPKDIPGYRIDGVAACRLAWQWFAHACKDNPNHCHPALPTKQDLIDRKVSEPLSVRLAGEYDVWDKRDERADLFQYWLRSRMETDLPWGRLLSTADEESGWLDLVIDDGRMVRHYAQTVDASNMKASFLAKWEGLNFLCLNGRGNSNTFTSRDVPETGHDALLMLYFNGNQWIVSLYHAAHRKDLDLSEIAKKHGGGGHRGGLV